MNKRQIEKAWLMFQLAFLVHYTPNVIRAVIRIPRIDVPYFNIACLAGAYATTLYGLPFGGIYNRLEFICILFFLSQPSNILLFPFYLNTILNLAVFIKTQPRRNKQSPLFRMSQLIIEKQVELVNTKILIEIINLPVMLFLIILGRSNVVTLLIYVYLLRTQFDCDQTVRDVFMRIRIALDEYSLMAPPALREIYVRVRDYLIMTTFDEKKSK